jgi:hypothetical protein
LFGISLPWVAAHSGLFPEAKSGTGKGARFGDRRALSFVPDYWWAAISEPSDDAI